MDGVTNGISFWIWRVESELDRAIDGNLPKVLLPGIREYWGILKKVPFPYKRRHHYLDLQVVALRPPLIETSTHKWWLAIKPHGGWPGYRDLWSTSISSDLTQNHPMLDFIHEDRCMFYQQEKSTWSKSSLVQLNKMVECCACYDLRKRVHDWRNDRLQLGPSDGLYVAHVVCKKSN